MKIYSLLWIALFGGLGFRFEWGFFAHKKINTLAIYSLPPAMIGFYKKHITQLSDDAVLPDKRRYLVEDEAPKHYIDLDLYDSISAIPKYWNKAVEQYGEDSLLARGVVVWHVYYMYIRLRDAFASLNAPRIARLSAELGHYVSDINVPLHTTSNYNGQFTGQRGIHGLWESRLPELFFRDYDLWVGKATYTTDVQQRAWQAVKAAHQAVDSVLHIESQLFERHSKIKYGYRSKGKGTVKVVSLSYARQYHQKLDGMVERQFKLSIKMTADLWYTAWVDAGQPHLDHLTLGTIPTDSILLRKKAWHILQYDSSFIRPH